MSKSQQRQKSYYDLGKKDGESARKSYDIEHREDDDLTKHPYFRYYRSPRGYGLGFNDGMRGVK